MERGRKTAPKVRLGRPVGGLPQEGGLAKNPHALLHGAGPGVTLTFPTVDSFC